MEECGIVGLASHPARELTRAGGAIQVEDELIVPLREAELAVVAIVPVPETVALVPDAVALRDKLPDPAPPATWSSSVSLSSIRNSIIS